ncbi:pentatricopeptide repeat (PPR-like) superfamily protein [Striga asiatica]|uniref:Pentatricopeptide repeat (PPR-like) superfamily protein n=1 Tax=Striga asiatica TaxID=4170 RepID=A0A5A7R8U6_STRAF|nr:pentatricopeptide repeat (PPR-like) superfamily protein [Striga asiatica]
MNSGVMTTGRKLRLDRTVASLSMGLTWPWAGRRLLVILRRPIPRRNDTIYSRRRIAATVPLWSVHFHLPSPSNYSNTYNTMIDAYCKLGDAGLRSDANTFASFILDSIVNALCKKGSVDKRIYVVFNSLKEKTVKGTDTSFLLAYCNQGMLKEAEDINPWLVSGTNNLITPILF